MNYIFFQKFFMILFVATLSSQTTNVPTKTTNISTKIETNFNVANIESRQSYPIDRNEICRYLIDAYIMITGQKPNSSSQNNPFHDVSSDTQPYILQCYSLGIVNGTSENSFSPNKAITKNEFSIMLHNFAKITAKDTDLSGGDSIVFPESIPDNLLPSIQFAYSRGLIHKNGFGTLGLNEKVSLGEATEILYKLVRSAPNYPIVSKKYETKRAYLTFDDSTSENTYLILDVLKQYNVKATFFLAGECDPELVKRIASEGHTIGNHTMTHQYYNIYASADAFWKDFEQEQNYIKNITGKSPVFMRFPGGSNNSIGVRNQVMESLTAQSKSKGYIYVDWNVDSKDAIKKTNSKENIVANVLSGAKYKTEAIILMHQSAPKTTTPQALPEIIEGLQSMGFEIQQLSGNSYCPKFIK